MTTYNILDFGAAESDLLQTAAIQSAIDAAFLAGGGEVTVPAGFYRTGGLILRSGVTLHLLAGAVLEGSRDPADYAAWRTDPLCPEIKEMLAETGAATESRSADPFSRWNQSLIRARNAENIAVIGEPGCCIDGQNCFDALGEEQYRGPHGIDLWDCKNVTLRGYTIRNTGNWAHAVFRCENVRFEGLTVLGGHDGIDVFLCDGVTAESCRIQTGDDAVAGFGSIHVTVRDCELNSSCSCVRFGGTDALFERCHAAAPGRYAFRGSLTPEEKALSLMPGAGHRRNTLNVFLYYCDTRFGRLPYEPGGIVFRDCRFDGVDRLFCMAFGEHIWCAGAPLRDISFENCSFTGLRLPAFVHGDADTPFRMTMRDCTLAPAPEADPDVLLDAELFDAVVFENVDLSAYRQPTVVVRGAGRVLSVGGSTVRTVPGQPGASGFGGN